LLAYRAQAPMIDKLLAEAGFANAGNPLQSLMDTASGAGAKEPRVIAGDDVDPTIAPRSKD